MEILVQDLKKSFEGQAVLNGVSLRAVPGKITFIIGGSGQGKSVFLKHLIGLLRSDSGSIRVDGQELTGLSEAKLLPIRRRIGMIFQGGALLASITVGENVALGLVENGLASRKDSRATRPAKNWPWWGSKKRSTGGPSGSRVACASASRSPGI